MDLDIKYRPKTLDEVVGQPAAVGTIRSFGKNVPRAVLLHGPPGTGKTTLARIVVNDVLGVSAMDLREVNCGAAESATDMVRDINASMTMAPMTPGGRRVWILDEVQVFSKTKQAQETLLKVLEDCPSHVGFFLCTTDPKRLLPAVRTRCVQIELSPVGEDALGVYADRIAAGEKLKLEADVRRALIVHSEACPRNLAKLFEKIVHVPDAAGRLAAITSLRPDEDAFGLVKALLPWKGGPDWKGVAKVLSLPEVKDQDPEGLRQMILASARTMLLKTGSMLAYRVICCLDKPLYDRNSGHAQLAAYCFEICKS